MSKATILIVEDEAIVAADIAGKLNGLGYEVVGTAARGEDAIALSGRLRPRLVLMDIRLKGPMDGIEAAGAIRNQHDIPVIYLTGSDADTLARAKVTGPFGFVLKPYDERDLATQIEMALFKYQTDRQLREQREWLRVTLMNIGDAVIATDAEGRVTFLNPLAETLTGWKAAEAAGQPVQCVFRIVDEQTGRPLEEPVARVLRGDRAIELANHAAVVTKDGRMIPVEDSAVPILDAAGQAIGVLLVFHDVTEKRRAEEALRLAEAAAEAGHEAKSQILSDMSHELRTPMNAILGMIDVALPKATDPTVQDCLHTAKGAADLLLTLLNDLLDSAKIESGRLELESAPFSLRRMLDQITRVLTVRASEKGLAFYCRVPAEMPDAVTGDRMRLQQVLLNLANNAIKCTERGEVEMRLRAQSQSDETDLEFAVRDTGTSIPPAGLERLFQPLSQTGASATRRFGGTGLGLSICRDMVEMMGGRIWADSEIGKGNTIYVAIRLPLAEDSPVHYEVALPTSACGQLRVLLVDDNPANQKLATYILRDRGHVTEIAGNGQEAIDLTEQNRYDVILMDVQMPGVNGLEATAAIRKREGRDRRVPIIAMTAHAMRGDRDRCLAAGMDGYLSKPVNAQEMIGLVECLACGGVPVTRNSPATSSRADAPPQATALAFNPAEALARCFNSRDMLREMIQCFLDEVDNLFPRMRAALVQNDLAEVGRLGHRMRGTVVYLGAHPATEAALRVERVCKSSGSTPSEAEDAITALEQEYIALKAALTGHLLAADPTPGTVP